MKRLTPYILLVFIFFYLISAGIYKSNIKGSTINPNIFVDFRNIETGCRQILKQKSIYFMELKGICLKALMKKKFCENNPTAGGCSAKAYYYYLKDMGFSTSSLKEKSSRFKP